MIIIMWDRVCKSLILKVFASSIKFGQRMKRLFYKVAPYSLKEIIQKNLQYYILFIFIKERQRLLTFYKTKNIFRYQV